MFDMSKTIPLFKNPKLPAMNHSIDDHEHPLCNTMSGGAQRRNRLSMQAGTPMKELSEIARRAQFVQRPNPSF